MKFVATTAIVLVTAAIAPAVLAEGALKNAAVAFQPANIVTNGEELHSESSGGSSSSTFPEGNVSSTSGDASTTTEGITTTNTGTTTTNTGTTTTNTGPTTTNTGTTTTTLATTTATGTSTTTTTTRPATTPTPTSVTAYPYVSKVRTTLGAAALADVIEAHLGPSGRAASLQREARVMQPMAQVESEIAYREKFAVYGCRAGSCNVNFLDESVRQNVVTAANLNQLADVDGGEIVASTTTTVAPTRTQRPLPPYLSAAPERSVGGLLGALVMTLAVSLYIV